MAGISSRIEDYLKAMMRLQQSGAVEWISTTSLATAIGVSPGTATTMTKRLFDRGLVDYEARVGSRLTPDGTRLALQVLRKHRIIESFLVEILKLDWAEVHREAEALEHAASAVVVERMAEILSHPSTDPHGDPIPSESGVLGSAEERPLSACSAGDGGNIQRIRDHTPEFLRFAKQAGLVPGAVVVVENTNPPSGTIDVKVGGSGPTITLGTSAASRILLSGGDE